MAFYDRYGLNIHPSENDPPGMDTIPSMPVPGDIFELARDVSELAAAIRLWQNGKITWEQAMMVAVRALAETNKHLQVQVRGMVLNTIPNYTVSIKQK